MTSENTLQKQIQGYSLASTRTKDLPEPPMLFEGRVPMGTTIIYARPGCGKSMLGAQIEEHLAWERPLGTWKSNIHGDCLVIDFEGNEYLSKSRSLRITPFGEIRSDHTGNENDNPGNIYYYHELTGNTFAEHFSGLVELLNMKAMTGKPFVYVRIDTLNAFIGPAPRGMNSAEWASQCLIPLNQEMMNRNIACLLMHHTNKGNEMSGSVVLSGSVNMVLEMERTANCDEGIIRTKKMRMAAEWEMACVYQDGMWEITEEMTPEQVMRTGIPRKILDFLATTNGMATRGEIEANLTGAVNTVKMALSRMKNDGVLKYQDGYWMLTKPTPKHTGHVQDVIKETFTETPGTPSEPAPKSRPVAPVLVLDKSEMNPDDPKKGAIKASMKLLKKALDGSIYNPAFYPDQPDVDSVWEGRNKYEAHIEAGTPMVRLDKAAAYLSAANTLLPIGALERDETPLGVDDRKNGKKICGYHLIDVPANHYWLGGPFATREEKGRVWVTTPTLKMLNEYHKKKDILPLVVHDSWTAIATEVMLRPWIDALKTERKTAIENNDDTLYAYIKSCYSLVISTMGESRSNWEITRPDWMHIIRAQAYANLWRVALQALEAGVKVRKVGNTDEIWVVDDDAARAFFKVGRNLGEWSVKNTWVQE